MTREEAKCVLGNRRKWEYRAMAKALSLQWWCNDENDWRRCDALRALGYRTPRRKP
jgi:hypothetical protein